MFEQFLIATRLLLVLTILTGGLYPLTVTAIAQLFFYHQANGSLINANDKLVGSELIGQQFTKAEYFWGRLSATAPVPYHAGSSGGSNLGPLHPGLAEAVNGRISALSADGNKATHVPVDLVTSSASGLDPHISPAAARFQVPRVAKARGMTEVEIQQLVSKQTEGRQLGILGEPRVNVLRLNRELDRLQNGK